MTATTHAIWSLMMSRCYDENFRNYSDYGGRGITVCRTWHKYTGFLRSMGERPERMTLERIDTNKSYNPSNCRWATMSENNSNKRNNHYISCMGIILSAREWENLFGLSDGCIHRRVKRGWPVGEAIGTPLGANHRLDVGPAEMVAYGSWRNVWYAGQLFKLAPGRTKAHLRSILENISYRICTGEQIIDFENRAKMD